MLLLIDGAVDVSDSIFQVVHESECQYLCMLTLSTKESKMCLNVFVDLGTQPCKGCEKEEASCKAEVGRRR